MSSVYLREGEGDDNKKKIKKKNQKNSKKKVSTLGRIGREDKQKENQNNKTKKPKQTKTNTHRHGNTTRGNAMTIVNVIAAKLIITIGFFVGKQFCKIFPNVKFP